VRVAVSCAIISAAVSRRPDFIAASLADKAEARIGDAGRLLLVPHLMLALAATGRAEAASRFVAQRPIANVALDPSAAFARGRRSISITCALT
jgi:hypothetical protein